MDLSNYIKKIISKDKRLYYYQDNIIWVCKKLNFNQIFDIIPLLDNDSYFHYFSFDWRKNLYNNLEKKEKLHILFSCYTPFFLNDSVLNNFSFKTEYQKIWDYQIKYYINQFENFILNSEIIINKDLFQYKKYINFKKNIQLPDGEITDLKMLILNYLQNKKKISKKTILFLNNNYLDEMKICKFYLMKK